MATLWRMEKAAMKAAFLSKSITDIYFLKTVGSMPRGIPLDK
jgi:hypothetical protein